MARTTTLAFLGNDADLNAVADRVAAKLKATADVAESQNARMAESADAAGARFGKAFDDGTTKAGSALTRFGHAAGNWGVPFASSVENMGKKLDDATSKTGKFTAALEAAGKVTVAAGLAGFAAAAYEGVKGAAALQKQMEMLRTQAGASQQQVGQLTKGVEGMAGSVGTGPQTLAQGMYHVVSSLNATLPAASRASTEMNVLRIAAEGAKVGNANLVDVTNALDAAVVSGISGVQNYSQAMGALNSVVGAGDMTMQDLADSLGTGLLAPMKTYGVTLKEVGGALAVFGDNNIRGAHAGTMLASALRIMAAPSEAAMKALSSVGVGSLELANDLRSGGIIGALSDLKQHLVDSGATASQQALVITRAFGGRQSTGVQVLLDQLDRLKAKTQDVGKGAGQFGGAWTATTHTLSFEMDQLKATVESLADKFGLFLIPKLQAVGSAVASVISWFEKHKAASEALAAVISGVLGVAVAAFAYQKAVAFGSAVANMAAGVGKLAGTIATAVPAMLSKLGLIGSTAVETETTAAPALEGIGAAADEAGGQMTLFASTTETAGTEVVASAEATAAGVDTALGSTGIGLVLVGVGVAATELATHWSTVMSAMSSAVQAMVSAAETALNGLISVMNGAISLFNSTIGQLTGDIGSIGSVGSSSSTAASAGVGTADTAHGVVDVNQSRAGKPNLPLQLPGSSNAMKIANYLEGQGFSKIAVAGILGNFGQETGGNTLSGINTADSGNGASGMGGMGIAQWTASRYTAEKRLAASEGKSPTDLGVQLQYLIQELRTDYHGAFAAIQAAKTPAAAAAAFNRLYEGGTDPGGHRETLAAQAYQMLTSSTGASSAQAAAATTAGKGLSSSALSTLLGSSSTSKTTTTAAATSTIPAAVATMLATAQALEGTAYTRGGGHSGWDPVAELKKIGVDCSGFVSQVLHAGGVTLPGPLTTAGLAQKLQPGAGQYVTVEDRSSGSQAHTLIDILGKWFESGGNPKYNPAGGVAQITAQQAAGELAGGGFKAYHPSIPSGPDATSKQLAALGVSSSSAAAIANTSMATLIAAIQSAASKAGDALVTKLANATQNGTIRTLESATGESTSMQLRGATRAGAGPGAFRGGGYNPATGQWPTVASTLAGVFAKLGNNATISQVDQASSGVLTKGQASSPQNRAYLSTVANLIATGQTNEARELVSAHKAAMATLAQELYANQVLKNSESLMLQATQEKDQTTLIADLAKDATTQIKDATTAQSDAAANQVKIATDQGAMVTQAMTAAATQIKDATTQMTSEFSAMAQAVTDATQSMADSSSAVVSGINDQTQVKVDILGERGLYGLNLIAQQQTVQLDEMKAGYDAQIATAQQNLDAVKATWDATIASAQAIVDQTQVQEDQLTAQSQMSADTVQLGADTTTAGAQAHMDAVQLAQDTAISTAQEHADSIASATDISVQLAQSVVDLSAAAPKAQQDAANAQLKAAQAQQAAADALANAAVSNATNVANAAEATAAQQYATAQAQGNAAVQAAQQALAVAQAQAAQAEAAAQNTLATAQGQASVATAQAQQSLQAIQDTAAQQEAIIQGEIAVTQAEAQTQYAGSGLVVNLYGLNPSDAQANATELGWLLRTQLPSL